VFETDRGECVGGPCKGDQLSAVPVEERDGEIRLAQGRAEPGAASVE
jgi:nitrite reductase/ring-hydroxylating ferredoxin subunit